MEYIQTVQIFRNVTLCRLLPITHPVFTRGFALNCLTLQMKAVRSLETPRNTKATTKVTSHFQRHRCAYRMNRTAYPFYCPPLISKLSVWPAYDFTHTHTHTHTHIRVCVCVCVYVCIYIYIYIHTYIHFIGFLFEFCICLEGRKSVCMCIPSVAVFESLFVFLLLLCCERTFVSAT